MVWIFLFPAFSYPLPTKVCDLMKEIWYFKSLIFITGPCSSWKHGCVAKYLLVRRVRSFKLGICRKFLGRSLRSRWRYSGCFMKGSFTSQPLTSKFGVCSNKYFKGNGWNQFLCACPKESFWNYIKKIILWVSVISPLSLADAGLHSSLVADCFPSRFGFNSSRVLVRYLLYLLEQTFSLSIKGLPYGLWSHHWFVQISYQWLLHYTIWTNITKKIFLALLIENVLYMPSISESSFDPKQLQNDKTKNEEFTRE